jgi:N-hydroxyarylamine O-acetyltransferase
MLDIDAYLERIVYHGSLGATPETLEQLHLAHMLAVPFENLDISLGRPILLDEVALIDKVVRQRRGGFCYELNGAFAALLRALGFQVSLLSARVARQAGGFGPEFDHLTLLVQLDEPWLADVGFGDSFRIPLRLHDTGVQTQAMGSYRLDHRDGEVTLLQFSDGQWQPQYGFTLRPHALSVFAEMCHYHQTSPQSHFTQKRICTRATLDGRLTLSDLQFISTAGGERTERQLADESEYRAALATYFDIVPGSQGEGEEDQTA